MGMDDLLSIAGAYPAGYSIGWAPDGSPRLVFAGAGDPTLAELLTAASGADALAAPAAPGLAIPRPDLAAAMAQRLAQSGLVVTQNRPTKARKSVIGFESAGTIAPAASALIIQQPQTPFRGDRFMVPSDIAGSFVINDIRVGKNSQLPVPGALPARVFQENAVDAGITWDTAQISMQIAVLVTNIGGAPQTFRAALYGASIE